MICAGDGVNDSADLIGDVNGDGVVNAADGDDECPEGTVRNDGSDPTTNLICISGASGSFSSGVVYAGVLGVAMAAGLLAL